MCLHVAITPLLPYSAVWLHWLYHILLIIAPTGLLNKKRDASGTSFARPVGERMSHAAVSLVTRFCCWIRRTDGNGPE